VATSSARGRSRQSFAQYQMKSAPDGVFADYSGNPITLPRQTAGTS